MSDNPLNNAHVRAPQLRRNDPDVRANDAQRVLSDPAVVREFDHMEKEIVDQIAAAPDGTPESIEMERELCRTLRTLRRLRTGLQLTPMLNKLREAEFRAPTDDETPRTPATEKDEKPYVPGIKE